MTELDLFDGTCLCATEVVLEYDLIQHIIYPYAYIYDGEVEVTTATFRTDPFSPSDWAGKKFANDLEEKVRAAGERVIEVKVYSDTTPLLWTDFKVEITNTPLGGGGVSAKVAKGKITSPIPLVVTIVIAALALIGVIVAITLASSSISKDWRHQPISEDIKKTWGRDTLIGAIQDFEVELGRTPTPTDELETMTDAELRGYCDELAGVIVPPGVSWWPVAILGGLGIGLAAFLAKRKKRT